MSFLGKKILNLLNNPKKHKGNRDIVPFEQASSFGVLFTWEGAAKEEEIERFATELGDLKNFEMLCHNPGKDPITSKYPTVSVTDISSLGKLNSEEAKSFLTKNFDYLFHLDFDLSEITKTILINTNAKCRVGVHTNAGEKYYELMIGINKSAGLSNFTDQMIKYVKSIR